MSMKLSRPLFSLAVLGVIANFAACSGDDKATPKKGTGGTSGGTAGKGGGAGVGGATGGAGAGGTAGATAGAAGTTAGAAGTTAGAAGSAGTAGTAGVAGAAGSAGTAGTAGVAGTAGSAGSAGNDAGGQGGEGGVPGCEANPGTIYMGDASFDEPGSSNGWNLAAEAMNQSGLGDGFVRRVLDEGHLCPGALALTLPFKVYGDKEKAAVQKASTVNWVGKTSLHAWVKVEDPGDGSIAYLNGIQVFVQSMGYAVYSSQFVGAATFDDFQWHEIVLNLAAAPAVVLTDVNQVGIQVLAAATRPPSAPMTPSETVIYIDDIYLQ